MHWEQVPSLKAQVKLDPRRKNTNETHWFCSLQFSIWTHLDVDIYKYFKLDMLELE